MDITIWVIYAWTSTFGCCLLGNIARSGLYPKGGGGTGRDQFAWKCFSSLVEVRFGKIQLLVTPACMLYIAATSLQWSVGKGCSSLASKASSFFIPCTLGLGVGTRVWLVVDGNVWNHCFVCYLTCTRPIHVSLPGTRAEMDEVALSCIPSLRRTSAGSRSLVTIDNRMARFLL